MTMRRFKKLCITDRSFDEEGRGAESVSHDLLEENPHRGRHDAEGYGHGKCADGAAPRRSEEPDAQWRRGDGILFLGEPG